MKEEKVKLRSFAIQTNITGIVRCPICKKLMGYRGFNSHYVTHFKDGVIEKEKNK